MNRTDRIKLMKRMCKAESKTKLTRLDKLKRMDAEQTADFFLEEPWCELKCHKNGTLPDCRECMIKHLQEEINDDKD